MFNDNDKIVDANYTEESTSNNLGNVKEHKIKGTDNIRYTAVQVSDILGIPVSRVRYYMQVFEDLLDLEYVNNMKRLTYSSLEKLKYIIKLKDEDKMTVKQIAEYCESHDIFSEDYLNTPNNPLAVEVFVEKITLEMQSQLEEFKNELIKHKDEEILRIKEEYRIENEKLKEEMAGLVGDIVDEKLDSIPLQINDAVEKANDDVIQELKEFKRVIADTYKKEEPKKSFLNKLFKK